MHLTLGLFCLSSHTEVKSCERLLEILSFGIWQQLGWLAPPDYKICSAISPHCHNLRRWPTSWNCIREILHLAKYHEWADWEWLRQRRTHPSGSFLCVSRYVQYNEDFLPVLIGTVHTIDLQIMKIHTQDTSNYALCLGCPTESFLCPRQSRGRTLAVSLVWPHHPPSWDVYILLGNFFGAFILCMLQECISYESASQST